MGNNDNNMTSLQRFQNLLRVLFQFDASDLDFGIYRILNYKREQIDKFITTDLVNRVEEAFAKHKSEKRENIEKELEEARDDLCNKLNKNVITPEGELKPEYKNTNIGQKYLNILARKREIENIDEIKNQVYNDLNNFFSRYYEEGDFIPQYRYSIKGHKYAIPYNGEEVKLYWANYDQYYIKTGMLFRDYTFKCNNHKVIFRIVAAKEELGSKKATKERFFVLDDEIPLEFVDKENLMIRFQYRELSESEVKKYDVAGGSNSSKQEKINENIFNEVIKQIDDIFWKEPLSQKYKSDLALLQYQLNRFAAKNTKDYFIHKNLKKFLSEQLDYYIKNEVLDIDTLEKESFLDKHITRAKMVREIGEDIIDFLAQIEDFQKRLWEKKKFVLSTDYVITLDKIKEYAGEKFLSELKETILKNEQQLKEWEELGFSKIENEEDLYLNKDLFDTEYKKLPLDTKYFSADFKDQLLENLTQNHNLDDILDGLLIKSENWQALNTILSKYREKIQTIYIDPPFNTGSDFLYKDRYKNSCWLSLINDRLYFINLLLKSNGTFYLHLDENANYLGKILLQDLNFQNIQEIIFNTNATKDEESDLYGYKSFGNRFVLKHNMIFYCFNDECLFNKLWKPNRNTTKLKIGWLDLISKPNKEKPNKIEDLDFFIEKYDSEGLFKLERIEINEDIFPIGDLWTDIYSFTQSEMRISENISFLTQKPEHMLRRILQTSSNPNDIILDFFAGSGTTLTVAQKLRRKWIGVEMADYFNEFYWDKGEKKLGLIGRLKIVINGDKQFYTMDKKRYSHLSNDINWKGGGFFQYQVLEQYEDTLDNLEINNIENEQMELAFGDKYLLRYFLEYETRDNPSLLNIDQLKHPFSYKLKVNLEEVGEPEEIVVDLPETFNYLLGLKVKKLKVRNSGRKYLFIDGEKDNNEIAIVWRENDENWEEEDYRKDKDFITEQIRDWSPKVVYINGQSILTRDFKDFRADIRSIESEFKRLMG